MFGLLAREILSQWKEIYDKSRSELQKKAQQEDLAFEWESHRQE